MRRGGTCRHGKLIHGLNMSGPATNARPTATLLARTAPACLALFTLAVIAARACIQSITIDEADCYLNFVQPGAAQSVWDGASQNHVLNSLLMRLATTVFGLHHVSLRAGALVGGALYVGAAFLLSRYFSERAALRIGLLACLLLNPFILDYLVAARGYSLALAFLMLAAAVTFRYYLSERRDRAPVRLLAMGSLLAGLSFCSNFAFGFLDAAAVLALLIVAVRSEPPASAALPYYARLAAASVLPGAAVVFLLCLHTILHWPAGQLWWGAKSLREVFSSVAQASLYELNRNVANPLVYGMFESLRRFLLPAIAVLAIIQGLIVSAGRHSLKRRDRIVFHLGVSLLAVAAAAIAIHWSSFRLFHLLLPRERTAVWLAPLCTLAVGAIALPEAPMRLAKYSRAALTLAVAVLGMYFFFCLRLTYFKEWKWDADVDRAYAVLSYYNHARGIRRVTSNWMYSPSLNVYRKMSGRETFEEFSPSSDYPSDSQVYVLHGVLDAPFISEEKLDIVYRSDVSDLVVAVRPVTPPGKGAAP